MQLIRLEACERKKTLADVNHNLLVSLTLLTYEERHRRIMIMKLKVTNIGKC